MAKLEVISVEDGFCRSLLEQFKQYASVPDDSRDALLESLLRSSILLVQEFADKAIVPTTIRQTARVPEGSGIIRLYQGGGDILSVTVNGEDASFDPLPGGRVQLYVRSGEAQVTYTTVPEDLTKILPTVFRYATALYDGEEGDTLKKILMEAL